MNPRIHTPATLGTGAWSSSMKEGEHSQVARTCDGVSRTRSGRDIVPALLAIARHVTLAFVAALGIPGRVAAATPAPLPHVAATRPQDGMIQRPSAGQAAEPDPVSRNVVARARMLECGHQWSNMKRAGTATGTWKEFSRGCLAQR